MQLTLLTQTKEVFEKVFASQSLEKDELFEIFSLFINSFEEKEAEMILELTNNFLIISWSQYPFELSEIIIKIEKEVISDTKNIYILPVNFHDKSKSKSSEFVAYGFNQFKTHTKFKGIRLHIIETLHSLPKSFNETKDLLFLVDDFVGSGETIVESINILIENNVPIEKVLILSIVIHKTGLSEIKKFTSNIYYSHLRSKGISDITDNEIRHQFTELMEKIESRISVADKYKFGYKRTESLTKLIRTPNNSFPIFWLKNKHNKNPPFLR